MANIIGTSFATGGFFFDPNLSPNNAAFAAAVRAVMAAGQYPIPGSGGTATVLGTAAFANPAHTVSTTGTNGTATTAMRSDAAPAIDLTMSPTWTGTHTFTGPTQQVGILTAGTATFTGPFQVNGTFAANAGGTATAFLVTGQLTTNVVRAYGPTAAGLVDMTPDSSSFVGTYSGMNATVTGTVQWRRNGNEITLMFGSTQGTSNANTMTMTGLPAALQTTTRQIAAAFIQDNGINVAGAVDINAGVVTFYKIVAASGAYTSNSFTTSGQKGVIYTTMTYAIT